jgi:uncharacterized damage-inducible protein DinB
VEENDALVFERVWRGDAEAEAYHGPAFADVLRRIDADVAARRPLPAVHSIHEIAEHVCVWRDWVLGRLEGQTGSNPPAEGWVRVDEPNAAAWAALRARLTVLEDRLLQHLRGPSLIADNRRSDLLRFLLHHDLHHGGQIALLSRAR